MMIKGLVKGLVDLYYDRWGTNIDVSLVSFKFCCFCACVGEDMAFGVVINLQLQAVIHLVRVLNQ